jgi:hypothetical protein
MISEAVQKEIIRAKHAVDSGEEWEDCDCCGCWHPAGPIPLKAETLHLYDCRNDQQRLPSHPEDYLGSLTTSEQAYFDSL